jgi:U3 small nucleolar RNA-associated protein 14
MPGRQAHGRSVLTGRPENSKGDKQKQQKSKNGRSDKRIMGALAQADQEFGEKRKLTPRNRDLDADLGVGKHARQDDDDDEDDDEDDGPPRKMRRADDENVEYGSDSSGTEQTVLHLVQTQ